MRLAKPVHEIKIAASVHLRTKTKTLSPLESKCEFIFKFSAQNTEKNQKKIRRFLCSHLIYKLHSTIFDKPKLASL